MSHKQFPGSIISKTAPTVVGPTGGEGGSASGIWTIEQADYYISQGTWPLPTIPRAIYATGMNQYGELGLGDTTPRSSFTQIGTLTNWLQLATGYWNTAAVKQDGTYWTWGRNQFGALGLGNTTYYSSPKQVGSLTNWAYAGKGQYVSFGIKKDGTLWSWGYGGYGQLGLGNTTDYSSPKQVGALTNWKKVDAGNTGVVAVKTDGTLWTWGGGASGQLGLNNTNSYSSPKQVGALTSWLDVAHGGSRWCIALKTDGTIWTWGMNSNGQLGYGSVDYSSPKQVGSSTNWATLPALPGYGTNDDPYGGVGSTNAAITTSGTLWTWGSNNSGMLGQNLSTSTYFRTTPAQESTLATNWKNFGFGNSNAIAVKTNGQLWAWGRNSDGQSGRGSLFPAAILSPLQVGSETNWLAAVAGMYCSFAIKRG